MDLIKDLMKIDNRVRLEKHQNFVEYEAVIPDIKEDVIEIIKTEGYMSIKKEDIMTSKIILRGEINYNVIYLGRDSNGDKKICNFNGKYEINEVIERENIDSSMRCMIKGELEQISVSILNERKIKINAVLNIDGSLFTREKIDIIRDIHNLEDVQSYRKTLEYEDIVGVESGELFLKENIKIDNENQIDCILSLAPRVTLKEARVSENKVILVGNLIISPIIATTASQVEKVREENIEFTQFIEVTGAIDGMRQESYIDICDFNYYFREDEMESKYMIEVECMLKAKTKVSETITKEVLQDAYCPYRTLKLENKTIELNKAIAYGDEVFSIKEVIQLDRGDEKAKDILSISPKVIIIDNIVANGENVIEGVITLDIAYTTSEPQKPMYLSTEEVHFKESIDIMSTKAELKSYINLDVDNIYYELNRGDVDLNIKLKAKYEVIEEIKSLSVINADIEDNIDLSSRASITIYIAKEEDTLWDVAKRYSATLEEIAQTNDISTYESLKEGQCLIIEKKVLTEVIS